MSTLHKIIKYEKKLKCKIIDSAVENKYYVTIQSHAD